MTRFNLQYGPYALIAGASVGLGAAYAEALAKKGLHLILIARQEKKLEILAQRLEKEFGVNVMTKSLDLGNTDALRAFITGIEEEVGMLVYNAAFSPIGYFQDRSQNDLLKILDVNIKAPVLLTKMLSQKMIKRGKGGIILMSSLSGNQGSPKITTYAASKAFNTIFAEGLWHELSGHGIDVLACNAGAVRTPGYLLSSDHKDAPGTMSPEDVVDKTLKALKKGPVYIPGRINKWASFVMQRLLPRRQRILIMHKNTKDLK